MFFGGVRMDEIMANFRYKATHSELISGLPPSGDGHGTPNQNRTGNDSSIPQSLGGGKTNGGSLGLNNRMMLRAPAATVEKIGADQWLQQRPVGIQASILWGYIYEIL